MVSKELTLDKVQFSECSKLLEIGRQTFYDAFGPPLNTEENIQSYLNKKFTLDVISKELQHPHSLFYFTKLYNKIVGYFKVNSKNAQTEQVDGNAMEIERIYVIKEYQGRSIGQYLLNKALQIAKDRGVDYIWLGVWDQNPGAIKFYERNGFKAFDSHKFVLGTEIQTDILMKLEL